MSAARNQTGSSETSNLVAGQATGPPKPLEMTQQEKSLQETLDYLADEEFKRMTTELACNTVQNPDEKALEAIKVSVVQ